MAKGKSPGGGVGAGKKPKHSNDANRPNAGKGKGGQRDAATVRRLNMYKTRPVRDKKGRMIHEDLQSKDLPTTRIQPDRRWFGNTRVIGQQQLTQFREEMATKVADSYTVLLREKKLPLQLLEDPDAARKVGAKQARVDLLTSQPFGATFGPGRSRKRPKLAAEGYEGLAAAAAAKEAKFEAAAEAGAPQGEFGEFKDAAKDAIFDKGQSKRIWGELYKVLDSSDVVIQVLDARDPEGTRCKFIEQHIRKNARHKHLLLLLNKCDLVPAWVTKRWLHTLSREFPTLAFHASITNPFGKGSLLSLLRQLARLRSDKQAISVGFIGYPNVGKSSVINALRTKKVCKTAPVPGETKVWQYVTLMKRVFLVDCPGVVYHRTHDSESDAVLKGVVRVEGLEDATAHVAPVLERVKPEYLRRAYRITAWADAEDFLSQLAFKSGKLLKGGDPDLNTAARMVLYDWQRGKIPFYSLPAGYSDEKPPPRGAPPPPLLGGEGEGEGGAAAAAAAAAGAAGAAEQQQQQGGSGMFASAVTGEDAAGEAGARPESAAAAAAALRDAAAAVLRRQRRAAMPTKEGYYLAADEQQGAAADVDGDASDGEGGSEDEVSADEEGSSSSGSELVEEDEEEDAVSAGSDGGDDDSGDVAAGQQQQQQPGGSRKRKAAAAAADAADADDSGAESDGYGAAGLSWEAVLQAVQGGGELLPAAADADEDEDDAAAAAPAQAGDDAQEPPAQQQKQQHKQAPTRERRRGAKPAKQAKQAAAAAADDKRSGRGSKKQRRQQSQQAMATLD